MKCEYNGCNKRAFVKIMRWNYCIEHALLVLSSLYFLDSDYVYEMFEKVIKALLNDDSNGKTLKQLHDETGLHYKTIRKILQKLEYLHVVEKDKNGGRVIWRLVTKNRYLGLV